MIQAIGLLRLVNAETVGWAFVSPKVRQMLKIRQPIFRDPQIFH